LEDLLVGVVGFGMIGTAVAQAFQRMGCRIGFYDPAPRDPAAAQALGAKSMSLRELLAAADVVTLHVPLIAATRGMIGDAELAAMKPGAVLVQAARG
jgi:phosphoglycerate dehydrogenase-like enzyme